MESLRASQKTDGDGKSGGSLMLFLLCFSTLWSLHGPAAVRELCYLGSDPLSFSSYVGLRKLLEHSTPKFTYLQNWDKNSTYFTKLWGSNKLICIKSLIMCILWYVFNKWWPWLWLCSPGMRNETLEVRRCCYLWSVESPWFHWWSGPTQHPHHA